VRGPIRALVFDPAVTWAGTFLRRALEAEPGFAVDSVQRATKNAAIRAGAPAGLTRADLAPFEVLLLGNPDDLDARAVEAVRWFVEERGGVAVLVPDRPPARRSDLMPGVAFDSKVLESPVTLTGGLVAAELAIPRALPPMSTSLAAEPAGTPVVVSWRRGMGAIVVSGALDAWRYRDREEAAFARFWAATLLSQASAVPPILEVTATPSLARPGQVVHLSARLRQTEWPATGDRIELPTAGARAFGRAGAAGETAVRLWPGPTPGVYEGEWRPAADGTYALDVTVGRASAGAIVEVAADALVAKPNLDALRIAARATGGGTFADETALVRALADRFPARATAQPSNPARSPWWAAAFAAFACAEWALRRRQGLP
jgi:hypothetical protein